MMIPIGYDSFIQKEAVVLILPSNSSSAKRLIRKAEEEGRLFDITAGRKTRSVLIAVKDEKILVILATFQPETLKDKSNRADSHEDQQRVPR